MASFETSLYHEDLNQRPDLGLADLFGVSKAGGVIGTKRQRLLPYYYVLSVSTQSSQASPIPIGSPAPETAFRLRPCSNPSLRSSQASFSIHLKLLCDE